jgi:hypothetical protein
MRSLFARVRATLRRWVTPSPPLTPSHGWLLRAPAMAPVRAIDANGRAGDPARVR